MTKYLRKTASAGDACGRIKHRPKGWTPETPHSPGGFDPPLAAVAFVHRTEDRNRQGSLRQERAETRKKKSRRHPRIPAHPPCLALGGAEHCRGAPLHPPSRCVLPSSHQIQAVVRNSAAVCGLLRRFGLRTPRRAGKQGGWGAVLDGFGAGPTLPGASYSRYTVASQWHIRIAQRGRAHEIAHAFCSRSLHLGRRHVRCLRAGAHDARW